MACNIFNLKRKNMGITQAQGQKIKTIVKEQEQPLFNVSKRIIN